MLFLHILLQLDETSVAYPLQPLDINALRIETMLQHLMDVKLQLDWRVELYNCRMTNLLLDAFPWEQTCGANK